jgi:hypothetical protein
LRDVAALDADGPAECAGSILSVLVAGAHPPHFSPDG